MRVLKPVVGYAIWLCCSDIDRQFIIWALIQLMLKQHGRTVHTDTVAIIDYKMKMD